MPMPIMLETTSAVALTTPSCRSRPGFAVAVDTFDILLLARMPGAEARQRHSSVAHVNSAGDVTRRRSSTETAPGPPARLSCRTAAAELAPLTRCASLLVGASLRIPSVSSVGPGVMQLQRTPAGPHSIASVLISTIDAGLPRAHVRLIADGLKREAGGNRDHRRARLAQMLVTPRGRC